MKKGTISFETFKNIIEKTGHQLVKRTRLYGVYRIEGPITGSSGIIEGIRMLIRNAHNLPLTKPEIAILKQIAAGKLEVKGIRIYREEETKKPRRRKIPYFAPRVGIPILREAPMFPETPSFVVRRVEARKEEARGAEEARPIIPEKKMVEIGNLYTRNIESNYITIEEQFGER